MVSLLHNISVIHYKDHIRLSDRRQTVSHDKAGSALHHTGKGLLDVHLRSSVNGGRGLIQDQHRRKAEHDPGNTQKLFLSLGQPAAILCDHGIISLWQTFDKAVCMGCSGGCFDLFLRGIRFSHNDIVPDGPCPEPGIL